MEDLRAQIYACREKNHESRYFIPDQKLYEIRSENVVRDVLKDCNTAPHHLDELVQSIVKGAFKVLSVLVFIGQVRYISNFIKNDQLQHEPSQLDHKIPFHLGALKAILPEAIAVEFDERQWEFAAPVFPKRVIPRSLQQDIVLPFLKETRIGGGGFGAVYEIKLHDMHQEFDNCSGQAVWLALIHQERQY
jgi:hypothetical protein